MKFSFLICFSLFIPGLKAYGQALNIGIHIKGLENKSIVTGYYEGNKQYAKDTLILDKQGYALWSENEHIQEGLYFVILPGSRYFDLLIGDNQRFEIYSDTSDLVNEMKIEPLCESSKYLVYQKAALQLKKEYEKHERKQKMELKDSVRHLQTQMHIVNQKLGKLIDSLIIQYQGSLTSKILTLIKDSYPPNDLIASSNLQSIREYYQRTIRNFPNLIDLSDDRLIYTPYLTSRFESYFNHLLMQKNDSLIPAIQYLMSKTKDYKSYHDFFRQWLLENYSHRRFPGSEKTFVFIADNYFNNLQADKADSAFQAQLRERVIRTKGIIPGATPLNLDLPDTSGNIISFIQLKKKDVILFFFDSECGPCKYTRSEIVALLNRLDSRNIGVYAVNLNNNREAWFDFIKSTGPEWTHVSGYSRRQVLSDEYMFDFLPAIFLLGPDKKIVAGNISFPETEKILRSKYSFLRNER